jgi:hypothetical protein
VGHQRHPWLCKLASCFHTCLPLCLLLQLAEPGNEMRSLKAFYALAALVRNSADIRKQFMAAGGPGLLLSVLAGDRTPPRVRRKALNLLTDLMELDSELRASVAADEAALGGIVALMQEQEDLDMHEKAMGALRGLVRSHAGVRGLLLGLEADAVLRRLQDSYWQAAVQQREEGDEDGYAGFMLRLCGEVLGLLKGEGAQQGQRQGHGQQAGQPQAAGQQQQQEQEQEQPVLQLAGKVEL